jgi:hypothetical protein
MVSHVSKIDKAESSYCVEFAYANAPSGTKSAVASSRVTGSLGLPAWRVEDTTKRCR